MSVNEQNKDDPPRKGPSYDAMGVLGVAVAGVVTALFLSRPSTQAQGVVPPPTQAAVPQVGQPAPDFDLPRSDGKGDIKLASLIGQQVLLVFYRTHT